MAAKAIEALDEKNQPDSSFYFVVLHVRLGLKLCCRVTLSTAGALRALLQESVEAPPHSCWYGATLPGYHPYWPLLAAALLISTSQVAA